MSETVVGIRVQGKGDPGSIAAVSRALSNASRETEELRRALNDAEDSFEKLERQTKQTDKSLDDVGDEYEELARQTKQYERQLEAVMRAQAEMGEKNEYAARSLVQAHRREQYELGKRAEFDEDVWQRRRGQLTEERELKRAQAKEDAAARREEWAAAKRRGELWRQAEMGIMAAGAAVAYYAAESYKAAGVQDSLMRQVATISDSGVAGLGAMKAQAMALGSELKILPNVMAQTLYQAQSLGSDDIWRDAELASKAAVAGYTEANKTLDAGLMVMNAYEDGLYDLEKIYDLLFKGVELGAFTMDELAGGLSEVTSVAGETGTRLEDVLSMLVVMTKQGDSFNEAVELSGLLLMQLGTEGTAAATAFTEATGQSYRDFIAAGGSMVEALDALDKHAAATGKTVGEILGGNSPFYRDTQAARAAMELTGFRLEELRDTSIEVSDAAGTMAKNYEIMAEGMEQDTAGITVGWENLKIATGEWLASLEAVPAALAGITEILNLASGASGATVAGQIEANAEAVGDLKKEVEGLLVLTPAFEASVPAWLSPGRYAMDWLGYQLAVNEVTDEVEARISAINTKLAEEAESAEAYREALSEIYGDAIQFTEDSAVITGNGFKVYLDEIDTLWAGAQAGIQKATVDLESFDRVLRGSDRREVNLFSFAEREARETAESIARATQAAQDFHKVTKILDGDTLDIEGTGTVRLRGVDTPETAKGWLGQAGMPWGQEAMEFTQEFLINPMVTVAASGTDPYDRAIASVLNGEGANLEEELLRAGLALPLPVELTGDEAYSNKLEMLARRAADQQKGIFSDERVADAFLEGRIGNMEDLVAMYGELEKADAAYYSTYLGYLNTTVSSLAEMQAALESAAVSKALLEAGFENAPAILDMAVAMGVMTEEEAALREQFAQSSLLIDEYAVVMGNANEINTDMAETMMLLTTGLFDSTEEAAALAGVMTGPMVQAFVEAAKEGGTLEDVLARIGFAIETMPKTVQVAFESDLSNWNPPTAGAILPPGMSGTTDSGHVYGADGGLVTGGIPGKDSVRAMLMPGEYVLSASAVRDIGVERLHQINSGVTFSNTFNVEGGAQMEEIAAVVQEAQVVSEGRLRRAWRASGYMT